MEEQVMQWGEIEVDADAVESPEIIEVTIIDAAGRVLESAVVEYGSVDYTLPEVGFQQTSIDDPMAETTVANLDTSYLDDYNSFVGGDPTWETTRAQAREAEFSVLQTKYFSITTALDIVSNGMAIALFWGMLKDAQVRGRAGGLLVPGTESLGGVGSMTLVEGMVAALTLILWRFGIDDLVPHGESGVSTILTARSDGAAFPNEGSLLPFSTVLARVADHPDPLPVSEMLTTNMGIFRAVEGAVAGSGQRDPNDNYDPLLGNESTREHDRSTTLQRLWDHKFIGTLQTAAFGVHDRYSDWLLTENPALAEWVKSQDAAGTHVDALLSLTVLLEDVLDSDSLNLAVSLGINDVLIVYVERMIRFFKSYTTDLQRFSTYMLVARPATEAVRLMNLLAELKVTWTAADLLRFDEFFGVLAKLDHSETDELFSDLHFLLAKIKEQDIAKLFDELADTRVCKKRVSPAPPLRDRVEVATRFGHRDVLTVRTRRQHEGSVVTASVQQEDPKTGMLLPILGSDRDRSGIQAATVDYLHAEGDDFLEGYVTRTIWNPYQRAIGRGLADGVTISLW